MTSHTPHNAHKYSDGIGPKVSLDDYLGPARLQPKLGFWSVTALGVVTTSTWIAYVTSLFPALVGGGIVAMLYGYLLVLLMGFATALSLAECAGIWTTAGAQVDWVYMLSPPSWAPCLSYTTGWLAVFGMGLLGLGGEAIAARAVLSMAQLANPEYSILPWHVSIVGVAVAVVTAVYGILGARMLDKTNLICFCFFVPLAIALMITLLAESSGDFNSADFALTSFNNETGWSNSVIPFLSGLATSAFAVIAFDSVAHMSEELHRPARDTPRAMILAFLANNFIAIVLIISIVFTISEDLTSIALSTSGFPILDIVFQSTGSVVGTCFIISPLLILWTQCTADINISTSRSIYAFARSNAFPGAKWFSRVNTKLDVPVQAVLAVIAVQIPLLFINVGSTNAFTAFITMPAEALYLSYGLPSFLMLVRGRKLGLDRDSAFRLGPVLGPICNLIATVWSICLTVFLVLPPTYPVTAQNMNYSVLIVGALLLIAMVFWYIHGKRHFRGPESLIEALRHQEGMPLTVGQPCGLASAGATQPSQPQDGSVEEKGSVQTAEKGLSQ